MSGPFCPWCGSRDCRRCRQPSYEAPRHCDQCGQRLRVTVHPTGFQARCRRCATTTTAGEAHRAVRLTEGG